MSLDSEMLAYIAKLAALELAPEEGEALRGDLEKILGYVNRIQGHPSGQLPDLQEASARRPDTAQSYPSGPLFATASSVKDGFFSTPVVTQSLSEASTTKEPES